MDYEIIDNWSSGKNKPNSNPIYRGVASGEDGTNPNKPKTNPISAQKCHSKIETNPIYPDTAGSAPALSKIVCCNIMDLSTYCDLELIPVIHGKVTKC